jgi:NADPH-dependent glutamate synthase beta subunit-like oxidoreductase/NAD-dependent dihydropyrimidine dehydrogenase PreA subunit
MKRPKDRLHSVMVLGSTPAGVVAVNKLGELGIPVTLVDREPDMDHCLSAEAYRFNSGVPFNYAHRPGLIRILRNPGIRCIMPVQVDALKHTPQGFSVRLTRRPTYVDPQRCTLCGRCVEICPAEGPWGARPIRFYGRTALPGRPVIDKRRQPLCQEHCPLGVNVQGYMALARRGRYAEALALIRQRNVLPGICGRVCTHPCETACRRQELDDPLAIREIKRSISDWGRAHPESAKAPEIVKNGRPVAVIGSGPAGLAAAAELALGGYAVTLFEKEKAAGGLLRFGIGPHRLPRQVIDDELAYIEGLGVTIKTGQSIDLTSDLAALAARFEGLILATGTWLDRRLGVPGEDLAGVEGCLSFLARLYRCGMPAVTAKVAVIGDGNAAFDLARTLRRLGAAVTILSWFAEEMIPAAPEEIMAARQEGIVIRDRCQVKAFLGENGRLARLRLAPTQPGEPDDTGIAWPVSVPGAKVFELEFEKAFVAIGQASPLTGTPLAQGLRLTPRGLIAVDDAMRTGFPGIYAAGDAVSGPSSVVHAMASGRKAALVLDRHLSGKEPQDPTHQADPLRPQDREFDPLPADLAPAHRFDPPQLEAGARCVGFAEVAQGLDPPRASLEAQRCLQCGACSLCLACEEACGPIMAICHAESSETTTEHTGVVIIADPDLGPKVTGEDVIRAYGPTAAKPDIYAMLQRGYAAAAQAAVLLGQTPGRPKGHGILFSAPDPGLSPVIRIGVFACRCNNSFGWRPEMDAYLKGLLLREDVVCVQTLDAACVAQGATQIIASIREKGITRAVLASCVCCPLNFICSACTDQRSRLKDALFNSTGISRSMVETCNLRGEALRLVQAFPDLALERFCGLIDRSITRARRLKAFPLPARDYHFATAVIGASEAALYSAWTLAEIGLEVFLFPTAKHPIEKAPSHANIQSFAHITVKSISGTLGNFQILAEAGDFQQTIQVGGIILGDSTDSLTFKLIPDIWPGRAAPSLMQKKDHPGIPFCFPGATPVSGLFVADPPGISISKRRKGAAAAVLAAASTPRGPRQSRGLTVTINESLCRGCGRCMAACPYRAISFQPNTLGGWQASVDAVLCKGCGNCISVCPSNAADSPYRDQAYLERTIAGILNAPSAEKKTP